MAPIRVAFIAHTPRAGGAERSLRTLVEFIDRQTIEPVIIGSRIIPDVESYDLHLPWWCDASPYFDNFSDFINGQEGRIANLASFFRTHSIDLVFTNSSVVADGAIAALVAGIPHVWHVRELFDESTDLVTPLPLKEFFPLMARLTSRLTANSNTVACEIERYLPGHDISTVYNGFHPPQVTGDKTKLFQVESHQPVVGFFGELSERKGIHPFVEMARRVSEKLPEVRFAVVGGDVGLTRFIESSIASHGLTNRFRLTGYQDDPLPFMAACDLVVVPSLIEPFSRVVVEAMLLRRPVVATSSGGPSEILEDGVTGLIVPIADSESLAWAVIRILSDPAHAAQMGERAHAEATRRFDAASYARGFEQVFLETMNSHTPQTDRLAGVITHLTRLGLNRSLLSSRRLEDDLVSTRHELAKKEFELSKATRELEAVYSSRSWRLGHGILGPLAALLGRRPAGGP